MHHYFIKKYIYLNLCILLFCSCSRVQNNDVLAWVYARPIFVEQVKELYQNENFRFPSYSSLNSKEKFELKQQLLNELIEKAFWLQLSQWEILEIKKDEFENFLKNLKSGYSEREFKQSFNQKTQSLEEWTLAQQQNFLLSIWIKKNIDEKIKISEEEKKQYYQQNLSHYQQDQTYHVRQIVLQNQEQAEQIKKMLDEGENFARLARDHSLAPDRLNGGDLGFIDLKFFPKEFSEVKKLKNGEVSQWIKSEYGFHIFKLIESKDAEQTPYEDVEESIEENLRQDKKVKMMQDMFEQALKSKNIRINEKKLRKMDLD